MKNKNLSLIILFVLLTSSKMFGQVGIGTSNPNSSAALEINSSNSGLLIPRINLANESDRSTIANPATSLLIYNPTKSGSLDIGFYYWNGSIWQSLSNSSEIPSPPSANNAWLTTGNSGTSTSNFLGTRDWNNLIVKVNNNNIAKFSPNGGINFGLGSYANDFQSFAFGNLAQSRANNAFALGSESNATAQNAYAIGYKANASQNESYAIGKEANSIGYQSYAIGFNSKSSSNDAFAIGNNSEARGLKTLALGENAKALAQNAFAIGFGSQSTTHNAFAIGKDANASGANSYAIGQAAESSGENSYSIGFQSKSSGYYSHAFGYKAVAENSKSLAIGVGASARQDDAIVIGENNARVKIGLGTSTPSEKLHVVGSVRIVDGTQGNGKVLTSDANGKATWQLPSNLQNPFGDFNLNNDANINNGSTNTLALTGSNIQNISNNNNGLKIQETGLYKITYNVTIEGLGRNGNGNDNSINILEIFFGQYGNAITNCLTKTTISKDEIKTISLTKIVNLTDIYNSYNLYIRLSNGSFNVKVLKEGTNIVVEKM